MNAVIQEEERTRLGKAAADLRYLLDRGYPKPACITLVGNRYSLSSDARHVLHRAVSPAISAHKRKSKLYSRTNISGRSLAVDGHNVLITLESALLDRPLVMADDGVVRDIAGLSSAYKPNAAKEGVTSRAVELLLEALRKAQPKHCFIGLHQSMAHSGQLAAKLREEMSLRGLQGTSETLKSVETEITDKGSVIVSANSAIMDRAETVFDLAGAIIRHDLKRRVEEL